ncbi:ABC transporter ATP-binding protein [Shimia sagamensis]|uniref:Hydroxymethylpyrimidine transport system ATP-binding protein n=1 Tax=Shimia sagamensis TaxID=1566352 RepID=A0ABY1N6S7_9RHOB|nr:ATP-binding cassette domain-containing protein [Shimia sagamensis]SMP01949.1 putative hydroxymethylpyrimidine transport system ATP-binding protein [Shimia sagamensis]
MTLAPGITLKGQAHIDGRPLFAPLSLALDAGRWTCLLGGSGVGKTTVLRLMANLPTGAVFDGKITATDGASVAERIAYMAQDDLLLPWATVEKNIALGARLRGQKTDMARLHRLVDRCGLRDHLGKKPSELSGGQRQRVALARTLMEDKPIILLDEPFSALDEKTRAAMQDLAADLLTDRTVLVVTHDPGEAARLGHAIHVMTETGLTSVAPPAAAVPRAVDAQETITCRSDLLRLLMETSS